MIPNAEQPDPVGHGRRRHALARLAAVVIAVAGALAGGSVVVDIDSISIGGDAPVSTPPGGACPAVR